MAKIDSIDKVSLDGQRRILMRLRDVIITGVERKQNVMLIEERFKRLQSIWANLENTFEIEIEREKDNLDYKYDDKWFAEVHQIHNEIELIVFQYKVKWQDVTREQSTVSGLNIAREVEKETFKRCSKGLLNLMNGNGDMENEKRVLVVSKVVEEIRYLYGRCKLVHAEYIHSLRLTDDTVDIDSDKWLEEIIDIYNEIIRKAVLFTSNGKDELGYESSAILSGQEIKLPRIPLPVFDGNVKDFPRFKADFTKYVRPRLNKSIVAYVLKSCLTGQPLEVVKNLADEEEVIWSRLDEKYGQPSKLLDSVLFELRSMKQLRDNDTDGIEKLATLVESAQTDLQRVGLERELCNAYVIGDLEKKLPPKIRREWSLLVQGDICETGSDEKFKMLMDFIMMQRRAMEYGCSKVRDFVDNSDSEDNDSEKLSDSPKTKIQFHCSHMTESSNVATDIGFKRCSIHDTNSHYLSDCSEFFKLDPHQKLEIVSKYRCCWNCLLPGHKSRSCWHRKKCKTNGCDHFHSPLLHEAHIKGLQFGKME